MAKHNSKFMKIRCTECNNEQVMFEKSSSNINCLVCNKPLATSKGGKSEITGRVLEVLE
ncbi:30S ribosomal protein S27e [Candidatus Woesearchaeota archaeon]|nr:30S ribosomal protein S27e [Candidatus Woesearchaeota archaeon]